MYMNMNPLNLVFLPATEPGDATYGVPPDRLAAWPDAVIRHVCFPRQVWYNAAVRQEAMGQIRALGLAPLILVGFSKSGLGAWNLARSMPACVAATIIFDAPMARPALPPWGTAPFYRDDAAWLEDLPLRSVDAFAAAVSPAHRLVLIAGGNFHDEMVMLDQALSRTRARRLFLSRPGLRHHWASGWIEEGVQAVLDQQRQAGGS